MASSPDDGSDMSVEDAAAIQQDLAGGGSGVASSLQQQQSHQDTGSSDPAAAAAMESYGDDPRDAPTMSMLADIAGAGSQNEQQQPQQADTTTTNADASSSIEPSATSTQEGTLEAAQNQAQQPQEEVLQSSLAPSASTNASLDALLGSLAESHNNSTADDEAAGSTSVQQPVEEPASEQAAIVSKSNTVETVTDETQEASAASSAQEQLPSLTASNETMADAAKDNQEGSLEGTTAQPTGSSTAAATFVPADASGPVPGLPDSISINTASSSSAGQDASMEGQSSAPSLPQIRQEATPAGTPTLTPATLTTASNTTPSHPQIQSQEATSATSVTAPPSSTSSTPVLKITQLASDSNLALSTAQQLLANRPQTLSRLQKLRKRVEVNKFDGEAWLELINDALQKGDLDRTREVYDQFLKHFPDNVRHFPSSSAFFLPSDDVCAGVHMSITDQKRELHWLCSKHWRWACKRAHSQAMSSAQNLWYIPDVNLDFNLTIALCFCFPSIPCRLPALNPNFDARAPAIAFLWSALLDSVDCPWNVLCHDVHLRCNEHALSSGSRMDCVCRFGIVTWQ